MPIQVGDTAPSFSLTAQDGSVVSLAEFLGKSNVVLFFYPKDGTPGCTQEVCAFRDQFEDFAEAGASVVGISSDSSGSHHTFSQKHRLPFYLLSDPEGQVRKQFGVPNTWWVLPGRVTYIVDKQGIVRYLFNSQLNPVQHVKEALDVLKTL